MKPYQQTVADVERIYETNSSVGLSKPEVERRLKKYGYNVLPTGKRETWFTIFVHQFQNPLIYILLAAAAIIFFVGENELDAFIISGVLFFNAIIGTIQEGRASSLLESLRYFIKTNSIVLRAGKKNIIEDTQLIPGDIIFLQEGQRVPADARIFVSNNLLIDEAVLTGESKPVRKLIDPIASSVPVSDQKNMVFKGTYVIAGSGQAIVVATGTKSEIGRIHQTVEEISTDIPLKEELDRLSYYILLFIISMCFLLFIIGIITGKPIQELLIMLTALFICVVPEGLPIVLTLVLVSGAYRMVRQNILVRNLQGVETLGRTDVIVIDKTGTLTRNEMIVSAVFADNYHWRITGRGYHTAGTIFRNSTKVDMIDQESDIMRMAIAASLLNSAEINFLPELNLFDIKGDPTEAALFVFSQKVGVNHEQVMHEYKKIYEIPFDSTLKYHAGFFEHEKGVIAFVIGSPEVVMNRCTTVDKKVRQDL
ncbi:MAG: HAD-IC family P-type ATPase, partial [bacterium]|nr:HAD-IC family P-type ATPase [bacterium]